jgi:hypothetical protein
MKRLLLAMGLVFCIAGKGQALNTNQLQSLYSTITLFILDHESKKEPGKRSSEFMFCIIGIDSGGKISTINILAEEKNKESTYRYLNQMMPRDFEKLRLPGCRGKIIMVPLVSLTGGETHSYIDALMKFYSRLPLQVISEDDGVVVASLLQYHTPQVSKENPPDEAKKIQQK